jgi:hypothetical protein
MKFVHLTPQPNISRIRRNGIRLGAGRRGRGLYAVPLMLLPLVDFTEDDRPISGEKRSSGTLWRWLRTYSNRHRNLAAVVFGDSDSHWPAELYLELCPQNGTDWLNNLNSPGVMVDGKHLDFVRDAIQSGLGANLKVTLHCSTALGLVMKAVQSCGIGTTQQYDESIEVVLPNSVPAKLIERIVPLYRTNKQFRQDRQQRDSGAE